jgi:hypothetical protein
LGEILGKVGPADGEVGWVPPQVFSLDWISVRKRVSQNLTANVETALHFEEVPGVLGGTWDGTRFTPSNSGTWLVVASARTSTTNSFAQLAIRKNGAVHHIGSSKSGTTTTLLLAACTVFCNGVTDYFEVTVLSTVQQPLLYDASAHAMFGLKLS